jgi:hypothetical protein
MSNLKYIGGLIIIVLAIVLSSYKAEAPVGSVNVANEYHSTSTNASASTFLNNHNPSLLKTGQGTFGSIVVTKAGTAGGWMNFYNATTSNRLLRTGQLATSSIIMASVPTDMAAGTYTFDIMFNVGLLVDYSGTIGTSTITYR